MITDQEKLRLFPLMLDSLKECLSALETPGDLTEDEMRNVQEFAADIIQQAEGKKEEQG